MGPISIKALRSEYSRVILQTDRHLDLPSAAFRQRDRIDTIATRAHSECRIMVVPWEPPPLSAIQQPLAVDVTTAVVLDNT